jgi:6-phosphofructokinase 1
MHAPELIAIDRLGECDHPSPLLDALGPLLETCVSDTSYVIDPVEFDVESPAPLRAFERSGPRAMLHVDPAMATAGIVTCGGLCPGLNNVVRALTMQLMYRYGVRRVLGFRFGYAGLNPALGYEPIELNPQVVDAISNDGGTILGSSRGPQEPAVTVDYLRRLGVNMLFCVGGDGTQRGALKIHEQVRAVGANIAVVGVPKTIDNDVPLNDQSFGYMTAVEKASEALIAAHAEARASDRGVGLVKLMGRDAGFIAAGATIASGVVNLTLVPELPFTMEAVLKYLDQRLDQRRHAVIAVAEGAGQNLFKDVALNTDASGNKRFSDIGTTLRDRLVDHFASMGKPISMKYIDPSYMIRGVPANAGDSILCEQFARHAVHAAMSGRSGMFVALRNGHFVHVPTRLTARESRRLDLTGGTWNLVLSSTGQPASLG